MHKILGLLMTGSSEAFSLHYKKTQALVKTKGGAHLNAEPTVVDWASADVEVLSSATDYCEGEECDVDELINIKSAFEGRLDFMDKVVHNYADVPLVDAAASGGDVSGATAEDRALARYVNNMRKAGLSVRRKIEKLDAILDEQL